MCGKFVYAHTKKNYMHTYFIALYVVIHPQQQSQTKSKIFCRKEDVYSQLKKMMTTTKNTGVKSVVVFQRTIRVVILRIPALL